MVKQIGELKLPPDIAGTAELFNDDTSQRTVSGRLVTKLAPTEKWRLTVAFETAALSPELQAAFYAVCVSARTTATTITFISPYDGQIHTATCRCTERNIPAILSLSKGAPRLYSNIGAVFEEI